MVDDNYEKIRKMLIEEIDYLESELGRLGRKSEGIVVRLYDALTALEEVEEIIQKLGCDE